jgi:hypothetical protein
MGIISKLLKEVENSAAPGLKDRSKQQGEAALEEVKVRSFYTCPLISTDTPLTPSPVPSHRLR